MRKKKKPRKTIIRFHEPELESYLVRHELTYAIRERSYIQEKELQEGEFVEIWWRDQYKIGTAEITNLKLIGYDYLKEQEIVTDQGFHPPKGLKKSLKVLWRIKLDKVEEEARLSLVKFEWGEKSAEKSFLKRLRELF